VPLKPDELHTFKILTPNLPDLSILHESHFVHAPPNTDPSAPNMARIFDVFATGDPELTDTLG
jgi:hypothetical protein